MPRDDRVRDVVERRARARADVEDADTRRVVEPQIHVDDVADVHEVAPLLAGRIAAAAFEQPRLAGGRDLRVQMERDACHRALVRFAGTIDVEVAQADDLRARRAAAKHG